MEQAEHARDAAQQRVREAAQAAKVFENEAAEAGSRLRDAQAAAERALAETRQLEERAAEARAESVRLKEQVREQTAAAEAAVRAARAEKDRLLALHKRRVSRVASQVHIAKMVSPICATCMPSLPRITNYLDIWSSPPGVSANHCSPAQSSGCIILLDSALGGVVTRLDILFHILRSWVFRRGRNAPTYKTCVPLLE